MTGDQIFLAHWMSFKNRQSLHGFEDMRDSKAVAMVLDRPQELGTDVVG